MRGSLNWIQQPVNVTGVLAGFVPLAYLVYFIHAFWLNIPRADSLRSATIAFKTASGTLTLDDILQSAIGHLTIPSYLMTIASVHLLDWNLRVELLFNFTIAVATFGLLMFLVWRTDRQIFPFVLFPASLLFFSVQQNLNWIIVYHGVWFHVQFLILLAATLVIFTRNQRNGLIAALVLTVIATFSHGAGAVGWGVLLLAMLFNGYRYQCRDQPCGIVLRFAIPVKQHCQQQHTPAYRPGPV
ncbi:MAG: hypothetical protein AAF787_05030 [Chloroflexota bacterium]